MHIYHFIAKERFLLAISIDRPFRIEKIKYLDYFQQMFKNSLFIHIHRREHAQVCTFYFIIEGLNMLT